MNVVIIPVYNPGDEFYDFVLLIKNYISNIIIVDDGSENSISFHIKDVTILKNKKNRGKGYSLNKGFKFAFDSKFSYAITIDGDGQHDPHELIHFLQHDNPVDILIGRRSFSSPMPMHRQFSNYITSFILSLRTSKLILDSQCGYRKYNLCTLNKFNFVESGFHFESEVLIKLLSNGGKLDHIDVSTIYNGSKSYIRKLDDSFKFIVLFFRSLFW